jgi:hypothetical protein
MLYDGIDASAPLLASLSGIALSTSNYTSTQRYMYVSFTSDSSVTSIGFNATFTTSGKLLGFWFTKKVHYAASFFAVIALVRRYIKLKWRTPNEQS